MSLFTYQPDKIRISIGIPSLDVTALGFPDIESYFAFKDWVSFTPSKANSRFKVVRGIHGESGLKHNGDTSRTFTLSLLQTSDEIVKMDGLFFLQTLGIVGWPLYINDTSAGQLTAEQLATVNINQAREKTAYSVAVILDEPERGHSLQGSTWDYQIAVTYGQTVYI